MWRNYVNDNNDIVLRAYNKIVQYVTAAAADPGGRSVTFSERRLEKTSRFPS